MSRRFAIFLGLALPLVILAGACGGDDDDNGGDDDDDDNGSTNDTDDGRTDSSNATGTLTLDGKQYTMDMETCLISDGASKLTVLAGALKGGEMKDFSASGIEDAVVVAVSDGGTKAYVGTSAKLKIDGKTVSYEGDVIDPQSPSKSVPLKFSTKC